MQEEKEGKQSQNNKHTKEAGYLIENKVLHLL